MRRFYLHTRKNGIYYVELVDPVTGRKLTARSTGTANRDEALLIIAEWLKTGIPTGRAREPRPPEIAFSLSAILEAIRKTDLSPDDAERIVKTLKSRQLVDFQVVKHGPGTQELIEFLTSFWSFEKSPYVAERKAHGQRIGRRHCYEMNQRIQHDWKPYFLGRKLGEITRADLKAFSLMLAGKGLSAASVNIIMRAGKTAFRWAYENELIPENPCTGLRNFSGDGKDRGILTPKETAALFRLTWPDERVRVANLLAAFSGMRQGEILGLQVEDVGADRIFVRHSWSFADKLKCTKTGKERTVPLLPAVRKELLNLIEGNPYGGGFVFYSTRKSDRPMDSKFLLDGLNDALVRLSVGDDASDKERADALKDWKARGVCFHSWRHAFAKHIADHVDQRTAQLGTGHETAAMLEHYAAHRLEEDFSKLAAGMADAFGMILEFPGDKN